VLEPFSDLISKTYYFVIILIVVTIIMIITDTQSAVCFSATQISCYCLQYVLSILISVYDVLISDMCPFSFSYFNFYF